MVGRAVRDCRCDTSFSSTCHLGLRLQFRAATWPKVLSLLGVLALPVCGGDVADTSETDSTSTGETSETLSSTTETVWEPALVRDLVLTHIEANQGVTIEVGRDGQPIPGPERAGYLLAGRRSIIRAYWQRSENWVPREVEARLDLFYPDGEQTHLSQVLLIDHPPFAGDLKKTFSFGLQAHHVTPGMRFRLGLWETQPGFEDLPEPSVISQVPQELDGDTPLGIESSDQALEIVVIPFTYNVGDCNYTPDISDERIQRLTDLMFEMNPIDRLTVTVADPVEWTEPLDSFAPLNTYMSLMRFENDDPPHLFYFGLIYPCQGQLGGYGGLAQGIANIPPLADEAWLRVSTGISLPDDPDWTGETFVHEIGHTQGRRHVDGGCGAAGTDPNYPYPNGGLGSWGFGVIDLLLRHPTLYKDYMTYCHPYWVSAWGWNMVYDVMRVLTQWSTASEHPEPPYSGSLVIGTFDHVGRDTWFTVPGGLGGRPLSTAHTLYLHDKSVGTSTALPTTVIEMPDAGGYHVVGELPAHMEKLGDIQYRVEGQHRLDVDQSRITQRHHNRRIKPRTSRTHRRHFFATN